MWLGPFKRAVDVVLVAGLIAVVTWTFQVKQASEEALERVTELEKQIAAEKAEIDLLKSDWSLLTSPARLQALAERYSGELELGQIEVFQLAEPGELSTLPMQSRQLQEREEDFADVDSDTTTASVPARPDTEKDGQQ